VAATVQEAGALAVACGLRVEVLSARTPWDTLTAEPTGELTWASGSLAERTRADGVWRMVDPTVVARPEGLRPVAPVFPMTFSAGGGEAPLARIEHQGKAVEIFWPLGDLPTPAVDGREIAYPSVLPGVDLVVTVDADGTGFSEVLLVKTAAAADNPALRELSFPVRGVGGLSVAEADGGLTVVDASGTEVFAGPVPLMWDSAGAASAEERNVIPTDGDAVAEMPAEVAGGAVSITPDQSMLDGPGTVWPVRIDPTFDAGEGVTRNEWAMLAEAWPAQSYHEFSGSGGVGYCSVSLDSDCVKTGRKRLVWEFNFPAAIRGAAVSSATFAAFKTHSADCSRDGFHRLYRLNSVSTSTNWNNHHAHWDDGGANDAKILDTRGPTHCTGWEEWNATAGAQVAADNDWTTLTLGLRATDEDDMPKAWRKYRNDATLSITFNRRPDTPGTPSLDPSASAGTGPSGFYTRDATPMLSASVADPDGAFGQTVRGVFQIYHSGSVLLWEGKSALVGSGSVVSPSTSPPVLSEGVLYTVRVWGEDTAGLRSTSWSNFIQFRVDLAPPATAPVVQPQAVGAGIPAVYVENGWSGGPGQTGKFAFASNGVTDISRYRYSFDSTTPTAEVAAGPGGASVSLVPYTPTAPGLRTLRVWTVDVAGWVGPVRTYQMWVNAAPKAAWWLLDGNGADAVAGAANPVTVSGSTSWVDGPLAAVFPGDKALRLDGATTAAVTAGPVVHTGGSYTATAMVNATSAASTRVAVSQDGVNISGFRLGLLNDASVCPAGNGPACWAFWAAGQDATGSGHVHAVAAVDPNNPQRFAVQPGTWTALAGVYDAAAHELRLYVNGNLAGVVPFTTTWDAVGGLRIGGARSGGVAQQAWSGDLDDVRAFRVALDPGTIDRVALGSRDPADVPQ
jgi:hypothetical protein